QHHNRYEAETPRWAGKSLEVSIRDALAAIEETLLPVPSSGRARGGERAERTWRSQDRFCWSRFATSRTSSGDRRSRDRGGVAGLMRAGSDDVRVAVGDVPVGDVAEKGLLGRPAAAAEVPPAGVQGPRDAHEAEGAEMALLPRGEQRGEEGGPALGHMALSKA